MFLSKLGGVGAEKRAVRWLPVVVLTFSLAGGRGTGAARSDEPTSGDSSTMTYAGTVVDQEGNPVADVDVQVTPLEASAEPQQTRTARDGRFELSKVPELSHSHNFRYLLFEHADYAFTWHELTLVDERSPNFDPTRLRVTLLPGVEFGGRVTDEAGGAVAAAKVFAKLKATVAWGPRRRRFLYYSLTSATDEKGQFRLPKLASGTQLALEIRHADYATYRQGTVNRGEYPLDVDQMAIDIKLAPGASIEGRLLADGKPLEQEGVVIQASDPLDGFLAGDARTDAGGRYRIRGLDAKVYVLHLPRGEKLPSELLASPMDVQTQAGQSETADLVCSPGVVVSGRVTDRSGQGVAQLVSAVSASLPRAFLFEASSGADGCYELRLPPGDYRLHTTDWGQPTFHVEQELRVETTTGQAVDFQITPRPTLKSRLVDSQGQPVVGSATVFGNWHMTDDDGVFSIQMVPIGRGGRSASWACWAWSANRQLAAGFYWTGESGDFPAQIVLRRPAKVVGQVTDDDGRQITTDMFVYDSSQAGKPVMNQAGADITQPGIDAEGNFEIVLPTGVQLGVSVFSDGYEQAILPATELEPGEVRDVGVIRLPPRSERPAAPVNP